MSPEEIDDVLRKTLDDLRLSRGEKRALRQVFEDHDEHVRNALATWRSRAFKLGRVALEEAKTSKDRLAVVDWLDDVTRVLVAHPTNESRSESNLAEVIFSPGKACRNRIAALLRQAKESADICVFTITDNELSKPILEAHRRGVRVRIISDDDKAHDAGSDVWALSDQGVQVRVDQSEHHMHHKYAVFDSKILVTGSYNWTRSAAEHNRENVVVTDDPRLVKKFIEGFESIWSDLG